MKANEAPEKIYLQKYDNDTLLCLNKYNIHEEWTERPVCSNCATGNDIEYTRTDAFIEKAMKYLYDYNQNMVKKHGAKTVLGCSEFTINVNEFKKYMEGE